MKVIFMGTPDFSVGTLEAIIEAGHEVVLVVTQPDKPKGRGGKMQFTPVKEVAVAHDIPVYQPKRIRNPECVEELKKYDADIAVVVAFGQIIPKEILDMPKYGCINVHASLLPAYRGAAPIQWAVINGEEKSGVTIMQMDVGLDTGDMIAKCELTLDPKETGGSLFDKLAAQGAKLCVETMRSIEDGTAVRTPQGETTTAYAKQMDKQLGDIDWMKSAVQIERLIRGLNPWPSAYTDWNGKTMKIWEAEACEQEAGASAVKPGTVVKVEKQTFSVQTGDGLLKVQALQIPGKKRMDAGAFLRGYQVQPGTVLKRMSDK